MKKFLQFSGLIAAVVAIVAFVLMLACPALAYTLGNKTYYVDGVAGIFGKTSTTDLGVFGNLSAEVIKPTVSAIIAFALLIAAIVILVLGAVLPLCKINALNKFSGLLNLIAVVALVAAGILIFIELPCYAAAQSMEKTDGYALGAGWIISAICAIVAGALAIAPAFADFLSKGKKKRK